MPENARERTLAVQSTKMSPMRQTKLKIGDRVKAEGAELACTEGSA